MKNRQKITMLKSVGVPCLDLIDDDLLVRLFYEKPRSALPEVEQRSIRRIDRRATPRITSIS